MKGSWVCVAELEYELGLAEAKVSQVTTARHGLTKKVPLHEAWVEASQSFPSEYKSREALYLDMEFSPIRGALSPQLHSFKTFQKVPRKLKVLFQLLLLHNMLPQNPAA